MTVSCSAQVTPAQAVLGQAVAAVLTCTAQGDSPATLTFDHGSLALHLTGPGKGAPLHFSPNRVVQHSGGMLLRGPAPGGVEDLRDGERRERTFDLRALFPLSVLDPGEFTLSFSLGGEQRVAPAAFSVRSGPDSVEHLLGLLDHADAGVRARAAALLHRMTAAGFDYGAFAPEEQRQAAAERWRQWWKTAGARRPWNPHARRATFRAPPKGAQAEAAGTALGGVAHAGQPLTGPERLALLHALRRFLTTQAGASLRGERWIADRDFDYPAGGVFVAAGDEVEQELAAVLTRMAALAAKSPELGKAALVAVRTAARMPAAGLLGPLTRLANAAPEGGAWGEARLVAEGMIDLLDPERVPLAGGP